MSPRNVRSEEKRSNSRKMKRKSMALSYHKDIEQFRRCQPTGPGRLPTCGHFRLGGLECAVLSEQDVERFHKKFYQTRDRYVQDSLILRHTETKLSKEKLRTAYFVPTEEHGRVRVCKAAFIGVLAIRSHRIRRVLRLCKNQSDSRPTTAAIKNKRVRFKQEIDVTTTNSEQRHSIDHSVSPREGKINETSDHDSKNVKNFLSDETGQQEKHDVFIKNKNLSKASSLNDCVRNQPNAASGIFVFGDPNSSGKIRREENRKPSHISKNPSNEGATNTLNDDENCINSIRTNRNPRNGLAMMTNNVILAVKNLSLNSPTYKVKSILIRAEDKENLLIQHDVKKVNHKVTFETPSKEGKKYLKTPFKVKSMLGKRHLLQERKNEEGASDVKFEISFFR